MSDLHPLEIELCRRIFADAECATLVVTASINKSVGVVVGHGGRPVGRWRCVNGQLRYFSIMSAEPYAVAADLDLAIAATVAMARDKMWSKPLHACPALAAD